MAHTPETRRRSYEKTKQRRVDWFSQNGPCKECGSHDQLELDHIDPSTKIHHSIWSWSEDRRLAELSKCQPLCRTCHYEKTANQAKQKMFGRAQYHKRIISDSQLDDIKVLKEFGFSLRNLGEIYGVDHSVIRQRLNRVYM